MKFKPGDVVETISKENTIIFDWGVVYECSNDWYRDKKNQDVVFIYTNKGHHLKFLAKDLKTKKNESTERLTCFFSNEE